MTQSFWLFGSRLNIIADRTTTEGKYDLIEGYFPPGSHFELELYNFHIDSLGHVNNAVYVQWMDIARSKLLEAIGMPVHKIFQQRVVPFWLKPISPINHRST